MMDILMRIAFALIGLALILLLIRYLQSRSKRNSFASRLEKLLSVNANALIEKALHVGDLTAYDRHIEELQELLDEFVEGLSIYLGLAETTVEDIGSLNKQIEELNTQIAALLKSGNEKDAKVLLAQRMQLELDLQNTLAETDHHTAETQQYIILHQQLQLSHKKFIAGRPAFERLIQEARAKQALLKAHSLFDAVLHDRDLQARKRKLVLSLNITNAKLGLATEGTQRQARITDALVNQELNKLKNTPIDPE